jgi:4-aminobutyrate aminotransferase-like enzyme
VQVAPLPDDYRGQFRRDVPDRGVRYADTVGALLAAGVEAGHPVGAFIAESLPSVGGQVELPPGYLSEVYRRVRAAGGVCIADEVQVGFGRLGSHFWGFATQDVVPDIVVLGKPIGNGFPLAAVVTTREIAGSFDNGMEFFSTFGGNPVACAAGLAVLDVLESEGLVANAEQVGGHLSDGLRRLAERHELIGDVRGRGLFLGVELVRDRVSLEPADVEAGYIVNRLRDRGVLCGTDGPHHNVLKIRPPLCVSRHDADHFLDRLEGCLKEDPVRGATPGGSPPSRGGTR